MRILISFVLLFLSQTSWALVDMRNANFAETWSDITVPGAGYDLKVQRTYNSRTLFSGMFGAGWCSDFETNIAFTPEGTINLTECGAGSQITYAPANFDFKAEVATVQEIMKIIRAKNSQYPEESLRALEERLRNDTNFRIESARNLRIARGTNAKQQTYFANGRQWENIRFDGNEYIRTLSDGSFQKFDKQGRLIAMHDKNRNFLNLKYDNKSLTEISDNQGRRLNFTYQNDRVKQIRGPGDLTASYSYAQEDLVKVVTATKQTYIYEVDDLHNLVKIIYPDKTTKEITYDAQRDRVIQFKDQRNCVEKYDYVVSKDAPKDHFWSTVVKTCGKDVVNRSRYEFWYKRRNDGAHYLHRTVTQNNSDRTDVTYHEIFGKPIRIVRNELVSEFKYNNLGQVIAKNVGRQSFQYAYDPKLNKVNQVVTTFPPAKKGDKATKVTTSFTYDKAGNVVYAKNSQGQYVQLSYDANGRIIKVVDQAKKVVTIKYDNRFNKPSSISREGLGAITIKYHPNGEIDKVDSDKGPRVAVQVASTFNNLLEIIGPATNELTL